ncbi:potassium channel family protein [Georgenia sp. Z1344]|uniref:potassium channel family protein n=1 Tax=Georgenia sp. Z1344 TaxID=3416706 RepID=UPI003CF8B010
MHVVIMGCGRVGASLAERLDATGHSVAIVDQDPDAFRRLSEDFSGRQVKGVGFDRETLRQAGIEDAYAFAAVSSGDNSNIIAARVARETFRVERVVARIYDPVRAEVYQRLGIPTVATVRWTAEQVLAHVLPASSPAEHVDASGLVSLVRLEPHVTWVGRTVVDVQEATGGRVAFLTRRGEGTVPHSTSVLQEGDLVHMAVATDRVGAVRRTLADRPREAR